MSADAPPLAQPLPLGAVLDEAVKRTRRHFHAAFWPVAVPVSVAAALIPLVQGFWMRGIASMEKGGSPLAVVSGMVLFMAVVAVVLAIQVTGYCALLVAAVDVLAGRPLSIRRAWVFCLRPRILGTLVLTWAALAVGFILCILPGIYVGLVLSLTLAVMVDEGRSGTSALRRSAELMGHNPQRDFGSDPRFRMFIVVFVGLLLGWMASFVVQAPFLIAQQVIMLRGVGRGENMDPGAVMAAALWMQVPSNMLGTLVTAASQLFTSFGVGVLFFDIRGRREGADLESAVRRLAERGASAPGGAEPGGATPGVEDGA